LLTQLNIQGLAVIESLSISFSSGFNVITGETGAGKSILIKALSYLLGGKASSDAVRHGREQALITGGFVVPSDHEAVSAMKNLGLETEIEDGQLSILIRRQISTKGKSQAWVNDTPVTTTALRDLGRTLIDIFGQHEHQRLLDPSQHLTYLDQFLKNQSAKTGYLEQFAKVAEARNELMETVEKFQSRCRERDFLSFRYEELQKFSPAEDEYLKISELCKRAGSSGAIKTALASAQNCLDQGADGGEALSRPLRDAARVLTSLKNAGLPELLELTQEMASCAERIDDLSFRLDRVAGTLEFDESEFDEAQQRLAGYQNLFRKFAVDNAKSLVENFSVLADELAFIDSAALTIRAQLKTLLEQSTIARGFADKLSQERHKALKVIKSKVEAELKDLAMAGAKLDVEFVPVERALPAVNFQTLDQESLELWGKASEMLSSLGENGGEKAQFLLASNPGEASHPLHRIASGGEVSRIMLAFKRALAADAETCVLVFDEIDTGISGKVADMVGLKLRELAKNFQILCISHLPQVTAYADTHFLVRKEGRGERTESQIVRLSASESTEELARLLSGPEITKSSLANAKALIARTRDANR